MFNRYCTQQTSIQSFINKVYVINFASSLQNLGGNVDIIQGGQNFFEEYIFSSFIVNCCRLLHINMNPIHRSCMQLLFWITVYNIVPIACCTSDLVLCSVKQNVWNTSSLYGTTPTLTLFGAISNEATMSFTNLVRWWKLNGPTLVEQSNRKTISAVFPFPCKKYKDWFIGIAIE